jgi:hypothetical protein
MNRSDISLPSVTVFAFLLVLFSVQLVPAVERNFRNTLPEYINDSQFPMGPTLSKGTVEDIYFVVIFYIPFAIIYFVFLISLIRPLWAPILASTSMLPASIQDYTGRFFGAIERCVSYSR